ncbi:MAG: YHYH protein [Bacteroidota bacterium]
MKKLNPLLLLLFVLPSFSCENEDPQSDGDVPEVYAKIYGATDIYLDGEYVVIKTKGVPDHKSPYYTGANFEAYNGSNSNFQLNPNKISEQNYTFRIPLNPAQANVHAATPLGAIGVSLNGVPFFNQYAGPNQPLTNEINSFDQYNGHPQQTGSYHYHVEPVYLTATKGNNVLLGFLLDGFPVYGPIENGGAPASLDAYHGHTHATSDFPNGIYHYHISASAPYINGDGFYGTAGTVTN